MKKLFIPILVILLISITALTGCGTQSAQEEKGEQPKITVPSQNKEHLQEKDSLKEDLPKEDLQHETEPKIKEIESTKQTPSSQPVVKKKETISEPSTEVKEPSKQPKPSTKSVVEPKEETSHAVSQQKPMQKETKKEKEPVTQKVESVSISITGDSEHGPILATTNVEIQEGDTVLDVLKKVTKEKQIQLEYSGAGGAAYIEGIDNLYEFDDGPLSGWMVKVNGEFAKKSVGVIKVKNNDKIEWVYTMDLGKDVGAK